MLFLLILCCASAFVACGLLIRYGHRHPGSYGAEMVQRFHTGHVPRVGGVGMLAGCTVGWAWMVISDRLHLPNQLHISINAAGSLWLVTMLTVAAGAIEDLTQRLPAVYRLMLTTAAAMMAVGLLGLNISRLGLPGVDTLLPIYPWAGMAFAVFAICGLPHAFNLIDGYNGLAGTVAMVCSFALAYVALQVGDRQLAATILVLAGGTAGFLVWNYPRGLLFAGDGGAYLWGVVMAICCIQLVMRHPQVSPWFPLVLLLYPVWETLFSIYRKAMRGISPGVADALHFHQLVYRRIVRRVFDDDESRRMLVRNNRTSPYLWGFAVLTVTPAVLFWNQTLILQVCALVFVVGYVYAYTSIIRFKVPRWLRR